MEKPEQLGELLKLQLAWVRAADTKVTALFAVDTAMLGVLAALSKSHTSWQISEAIFVSLSAIPLFLSVAALACVLFPRLSGPRGSNIFFGGIAVQDPDRYVEKILDADHDSLNRDYAFQIHRNSEIAVEKFKYVKHAFVATFSSLPFWLAAIYDLYGA